MTTEHDRDKATLDALRAKGMKKYWVRVAKDPTLPRGTPDNEVEYHFGWYYQVVCTLWKHHRAAVLQDRFMVITTKGL